MKLWSETPGHEDDTGAHNLWGICTNLEDKKTKEVKTKVEDFRKYGWKGLIPGLKSDQDECPKGMAIAGFRSKVEHHGGKGIDDTAFNKIQFVCRPLPICGHIKVFDLRLQERSRMVQNVG